MGKTKLGGILLAVAATLSAIHTNELPAAIGTTVPHVIQVVSTGIGVLLTVFGARDAIAKNGNGR